jgi:serine/threonine-protein kinase RsbW
MENNTKYYHSEYSSDSDSIAVLDNFLELLLEEMEVSDEFYGKVMTSVTEAFVNAKVHGNKNDVSKMISLHIEEIKCNKLIFTMSDLGNGFNHMFLPDPTSPENIFKECGRGVFLMRSLADRCEFNDKGNVVTMEFKLS